MLHEFITENRRELIARARAKVEKRASPRPTPEEVIGGVPLFLDQLVVLLRRSNGGSGDIHTTSRDHGQVLHDMGFTIGQVVHDYGDICQAVTELAGELNAQITVDEFHTLNRSLDDAIAGAVTEFSRLRDSTQFLGESERRGALAHELRNKLNVAMLAYEALKGGRVGIGGSTSAVLERNLRSLRDLIDGSLAQVRIEAGISYRERISARDLVGEVTADSSLDAHHRNMTFTVMPVDPTFLVDADRAILGSAISNLVQNALKFSPPRSNVYLTTTGTANEVSFAVEDGCGGIPDGNVDALFDAFSQKSSNRQGVGLGLLISRQGIEANGGTLRGYDIPGKGCVFTISVPRHLGH